MAKEICRFCMKGKGYMISLFNNNLDLVKKAKTCLNLDILQDESFLPQNVCPECASSLSLSFTFYSKCHESDTALRIMFAETQTSTQTSDQPNIDEEFVPDISKVKVEPEEEECPESDPKPVAKDSNGTDNENTPLIKIHHSKDFALYKIKDATALGLANPIQDKPDLSANKKAKSHNQSKKFNQYNCTACNELFTSNSLLKLHLNTVHCILPRNRFSACIDAGSGFSENLGSNNMVTPERILPAKQEPLIKVLHSTNFALYKIGNAKAGNRPGVVSNRLQHRKEIIWNPRVNALNNPRKLQQYRCEVCRELFSSHALLKLHISTVHCEISENRFTNCIGLHSSVNEFDQQFDQYENMQVDQDTDSSLLDASQIKQEVQEECSESETMDQNQSQQITPSLIKIHHSTDFTLYKIEETSQNNACMKSRRSSENSERRIQTDASKDLKLYRCEPCKESFSSNSLMKLHVSTVHCEIEENRLSNCIGPSPSSPSDASTETEHDLNTENVMEFKPKLNPDGSICDVSIKVEKEFETSDLELPVSTENTSEMDTSDRDFGGQVECINDTDSTSQPLSRQKYVCKMCGKVLSSRKNCWRHIKRSCPEIEYNERYQCDICQKLYREKGSLVSHMQSHTQPDLYRCDICDKGYPQKRLLLNHMDSHQTCVCSLCGDRIKKSYLKRHLKMHGETKIRCDVCNISYSRRFIKEHLKRHISQQNFQCECTREFVRKDDLEVHKEKNCPLIANCQYKCIFCDEIFNTEINAQRHVLDIHSQEFKVKFDEKVINNSECCCGEVFEHEEDHLQHVKLHIETKGIDVTGELGKSLN